MSGWNHGLLRCHIRSSQRPHLQVGPCARRVDPAVPGGSARRAVMAQRPVLAFRRRARCAGDRATGCPSHLRLQDQQLAAQRSHGDHRLRGDRRKRPARGTALLGGRHGDCAGTSGSGCYCAGIGHLLDRRLQRSHRAPDRRHPRTRARGGLHAARLSGRA